MATATVIVPARGALAQGKAAIYLRILIFSVAMVLKGVAGALFFGSVDLVNYATSSLALLSGGQVHLPYLPSINAFLWFAGVLGATLPVPFPLSLKIVPILFDSLLAVLIYDLVRHSKPHLALRAGLLYACSPVALLITCFQGQWDAIALFFLLLAFALLDAGTHDSRREFLFGALFGISLLIKPIGLPFLLLFPLRKRRRWFVDWSAILGLTMVLGIACAAFGSYGYSTIDAAIKILAYSAKGVQTFGLPFASLLPHLYFRLWIVLPMVLLAKRYRQRKLTAMDAMLLFYLCCLATTGLSPQYLLWPLPLLLATKRLRLAAFYTAVATAFLLLDYSNPWTSYYAFENMGVFAPLRNFSWLLPPAVLEKRELLPLIHALGNVAFPACAMVVAALVIQSGIRGKVEERVRTGESRWSLGAVGWYAAPFFLILFAILATKLTVHANHVYLWLTQIWNALPGDYGLHIRSLNPTVVVIRDAAGFSVFNVILLLALLTAIWCAFCVPASDSPSTS
jgi:hypothetical protein